VIKTSLANHKRLLTSEHHVDENTLHRARLFACRWAKRHEGVISSTRTMRHPRMMNSSVGLRGMNDELHFSQKRGGISEALRTVMSKIQDLY